MRALLVLVRAEPNRAIAENPGISAKTVGRNVHQKVGVRSRAAPTPWAFEHDLARTG